MKVVTSLLPVIILLLCSSAVALAEGGDGPLGLTLPGEFYAVAGLETGLYYDNIVLTQQTGQYRFSVACDIGSSGDRRWAATPEPADVGDHRLTVTVTDAGGRELERAATTLRVVPADAGQGRNIRLLLVGDSLTHATLYPNEIARLLSRPGNPSWKMLGTHKPPAAAERVFHEGYGGWTWQRFVSHYEPNPDGTYRKRSSPFVFLGQDGQAALDVPRYIAERCGGTPPDVVVFLLGINDCFHVDPDDPAAIDARIDAVLDQADALLAAFHRAAAGAMLGICLTPPPNAREEAFQANYKGRYHRWGWKRIQHRLVQRQLEHFSGHEPDRLYVVPTELNLDPIDGFPANNSVHPNAYGYRQLAASIYSWLKAKTKTDRADH